MNYAILLYRIHLCMPRIKKIKWDLIFLEFSKNIQWPLPQKVGHDLFFESDK